MASVGALFGLSLGINLAGWAFSSILATDHYFDLTGAFTHIAVITTSLYLSPAPGLRQLVGSSLVVLWAVRLGSFLFTRIVNAGGDKRLTAYLKRPMLFLIPWTMQSVWVLLNCLPVILSNQVPEGGPSVGFPDVVFFVLWVIGFALQVTADEQKRAFAADPANKGRWISTGVWSLSRHPNYLGEMVMGWTLSGFAWPALSGWARLAAIAPLFEMWLLLRVSGVPKLEKMADKRWGDEEAYKQYVKETPVLIPWCGPRRAQRAKTVSS